jgi:Fe-only nitrogenase accessory protein AnfO
MDNRIAVFLNDKEETTSLTEEGIIKIYFKEKTKWQIYKESPFSMDKCNGIKSVRERSLKLIEILEECRIFVASEIIGVPYNILDSRGFDLWEIEGVPEEFLDYVLEESLREKLSNEEQQKSKQLSQQLSQLGVIDKPIETDKKGCFYLNLKNLQETKSGVSSKQALLPFLTKYTFSELELLCSHVPPWIENFVKEFHFKLDVIKIKSNEYKVVIHTKA